MDKNDFFARTMHTPDSPERAALRAAMREMSRILIPFHRALIDAAKADYEDAVEPIQAPTHLLRLLTDDPFFAWLQPVTKLIVDIDEMARTDFEPDDVYAIGDRAAALFGTSGADPDFAAKYLPMLQRDIDVAAGLAAVRRVLPKLQR